VFIPMSGGGNGRYDRACVVENEGWKVSLVDNCNLQTIRVTRCMIAALGGYRRVFIHIEPCSWLYA